MNHSTCNRLSLTGAGAGVTNCWRSFCAAWVLLGAVALGTQGCASAPAASAEELTGFAAEQPAVNPAPALEACDPQDDEVAPLQASLPNSRIGEGEVAQQVTSYLNDHCFPLVRASFARPAGSYPEVIIYGFVATDFAKRDAEAIADALLANTVINVKDAIMVRPQLPPAPPNTALEPLADTAQQVAIERYQRPKGFISAAPLSSSGSETSVFGSGEGVLVIPVPATDPDTDTVPYGTYSTEEWY